MKNSNKELASCGQCIKYIMFAMNIIFFLIGGTIMGVGIWIIVDRNFMSAILGTDLMTAAAYLIIVGGGVVFLVAFMGCLGAILESKPLLLIYGIVFVLMFAALVIAGVMMIVMKVQYFIVLSTIFTMLLVGGILAIVFRTEITEQVKQYMREKVERDYGVNLNDKWNRFITDAWDDAQKKMNEGIVIPIMRETLKDHYGVELEDPYNMWVTTAWDDAQRKLYCCAVEDQSWSLYKGSEWYKIQPGVPEVDKPLVPRSCCQRDQYGHYIDLQKCQSWTQGPPTTMGGNTNEALHYRGCYTAGYDFVMEYSGYLIGMAIGVAVALIAGIVFSLMLYRMV